MWFYHADIFGTSLGTAGRLADIKPKQRFVLIRKVLLRQHIRTEPYIFFGHLLAGIYWSMTLRMAKCITEIY